MSRTWTAKERQERSKDKRREERKQRRRERWMDYDPVHTDNPDYLRASR